MGENITAINLLLKKSNFFLAKEDNQFLMSYYFNDLMSNQLELIDEKVQHDGLILLVFVSKNCQSGPLSSFAQHSSFVWGCRNVVTHFFGFRVVVTLFRGGLEMW